MAVHTLSNDDLRFEIDDNGIATITITRVAKGNSISADMSPSLKRIWAEVRDNQAIRVAIFTADGERHFCTGAEVGGLTTDPDGLGLNNAPLDRVVFLSPHHNKVWKPVICAVNGLVNGGGLHFVVDADIIVASENATFMDTHVSVGQVGALENIGLAKRLPLGTALRMTLMGKAYRLGAARAHALGLVDEIVPKPADVLPKARELAELLLQNSPQAMALSKETIWKSLEIGYSQAQEYGWSLLRSHWNHVDFAEGPNAFGEKRTPQWDPDPNARR